jgi:tRNA A37 threonylcarbamoyladenosine biosynthesis protein TsaE
LIEWFERLPPDEVDEYLEIKLAHAGGSERELVFMAHGERYDKLLEQFKVQNSRFKVGGLNRAHSV